jgi:hypothetical protein
VRAEIGPSPRAGPASGRGDGYDLLLRHPGQGRGHWTGRERWEAYAVLAHTPPSAPLAGPRPVSSSGASVGTAGGDNDSACC